MRTNTPTGDFENKELINCILSANTDYNILIFLQKPTRHYIQILYL